MFTRKLGHFLGLVFVLAAVVSGVGAGAGALHQSEVPAAVQVEKLQIVWE
jgi:hypothetical protein